MSTERSKRKQFPSTRLNFDSRQLDKSTPRKFALADFVDHESTAIVPINWSSDGPDGKFCWWPRGYTNSELRKAVHEGEEPDKSKWTKYRAIIRYEGIYEKCLKRERKLSDQGSSALNSEPDSTQRTEANGENNGPSSSATRSNTSISSRPSTSAITTDQLSPVIRLQKANIPYKKSTEAKNSLDNDCTDSLNASQPKRSRKSPPENRSPSRIVPEHNALDIEDSEEEPVQPRPCRNCRNEVDCPTCQTREDINRKLQHRIIRMLVQIKMEIQATTEARRAHVEPLKIGDIQIPLQSIADIQALELLLTPETIAKLQSHLRYHRDNKLWDTALRMMTSVFTVRVMRQLNWEGRNRGKQGLKKIAPRLTQTILDGAKTAVGDIWSLNQLRQKMRNVLVKATRLPLEQPIEPMEGVIEPDDNNGEFQEMLENLTDDDPDNNDEPQRPLPTPNVDPLNLPPAI